MLLYPVNSWTQTDDLQQSHSRWTQLEGYQRPSCRKNYPANNFGWIQPEETQQPRVTPPLPTQASRHPHTTLHEEANVGSAAAAVPARSAFSITALVASWQAEDAKVLYHPSAEITPGQVP